MVAVLRSVSPHDRIEQDVPKAAVIASTKNWSKNHSLRRNDQTHRMLIGKVGLQRFPECFYIQRLRLCCLPMKSPVGGKISGNPAGFLCVAAVKPTISRICTSRSEAICSGLSRRTNSLLPSRSSSSPLKATAHDLIPGTNC